MIVISLARLHLAPTLAGRPGGSADTRDADPPTDLFLLRFCATKPAGVSPAGFFVRNGHGYSAFKCLEGHDLGRCFPKNYQKSNKSKQKCDEKHSYLRFLSKT
ncbi:hypothetical protein [Xanthomonas dyei]|uniref:hypothetical protein n=1 Tax=Xanthomonas dyei TaxID=743699 RepID=UPI001E356259|nr:hypothetical protein [Xanthomonas dyei]